MTVTREQIEAAEDKDALEALGDQIGVNVDKRKGVVTIRAMLLDAVEEPAQGAQEPEQEEPQAEPEPEVTPASQEPPKRKTGTRKPGETRRLQSKKTGRILPWTAQLAKRKDMKEV